MNTHRRLTLLALALLAAPAFAAKPGMKVDYESDSTSAIPGGFVTDHEAGVYVGTKGPNLLETNTSAAGAGSGSNSLSCLIDFGLLHGGVQSHAGYGGYLPYQGNTASGSGHVFASFTDTITITSATLPKGTPVTLEQTMHVHGTITKNGLYSGGSYYASAGGLGIADDLWFWESVGQNDPELSYPILQDLKRTLAVKVGDVLPVTGELDLISFATASPDHPLSSCKVDALHTYGQAFTITTPGASFASASGAKYQAVPEPSTVGVLCVGAVGLLRRRRP